MPPRGIACLEEFDASTTVDLCHEIREEERDASLLVKGVETDKAFAMAILRQCKGAVTNPKTRDLVEWLIVKSSVVRGLFRETNDVAVSVTTSKLKRLFTELTE